MTETTILPLTALPGLRRLRRRPRLQRRCLNGGCVVAVAIYLTTLVSITLLQLLHEEGLSTLIFQWKQGGRSPLLQQLALQEGVGNHQKYTQSKADVNDDSIDLFLNPYAKCRNKEEFDRVSRLRIYSSLAKIILDGEGEAFKDPKRYLKDLPFEPNLKDANRFSVYLARKKMQGMMAVVINGTEIFSPSHNKIRSFLKKQHQQEHHHHQKQKEYYEEQSLPQGGGGGGGRRGRRRSGVTVIALAFQQYRGPPLMVVF
mmetsp:Transcript_12491/g.20718  ORF Transcript_12491/g.20718 Transcript_12491/m.20718 type:complete len:258 (-) Transcript_12491:789-1562(-)